MAALELSLAACPAYDVLDTLYQRNDPGYRAMAAMKQGKSAALEQEIDAIERNLSLKLNRTQLVVLSACNTAVPGGSGEGFSRA